MSGVSSTISLDARGKRHGFLRLPYSSHESAYGWIPIPIMCVVGSDGPTVLLVGGNHGDEYEGQIALAELGRELEPSEVHGRVIILPSANFPAAIVGRRVSPLDGGNLNRSFPGAEGGAPTAMIANFIEGSLVRLADCVVDLHSGGSSLEYCPTVRVRATQDAEITARSLAFMKAFGAPYACIFQPLGGENRTMAAAAERCGRPYICVEAGGGGTIRSECLTLTKSGIQRVLVEAGVIKTRPSVSPKTCTLSITGFDNYVYAPENGLFEPLAQLGQRVCAGQVAALIHFPDTPWREPAPAKFVVDGVVLCRRFPSLSKRGDCLYEVGTDD